jgi:hypothetical protein
MNIIEKTIKELNYCDLTFKDDNSIRIKLSYPRYFYPTNAYLIWFFPELVDLWR